MMIAKYKSVKADYLNRSPKGKWLLVRNFGIFVQTLIGVPVLDPDFKVNWYSFIGIVGVIDSFASFLYTLWYYFETPIRGFLYTPYFGVIIPVNYTESP